MTSQPWKRRALRFDRGHSMQRPRLESLECRQMLSVASEMGSSLQGPGVVIKPTVVEIAVPTNGSGAAPLSYGQASPWGLSPQQIRNAYSVSDIAFGSIVGNGAGQTIAIVDAYDDPAFVDSTSAGFATSDLANFDQRYGLPDPPSFTKFNQSGGTASLAPVDPEVRGTWGDWAEEEALDIEWAHAMAPGAAIDLVEANTGNGSDLYQAVATAAGLSGVSVVSTSWGSQEFNGEQSYDSSFVTPTGHEGVTFVASSGDVGSPGLYPAYSPNVLAVGGTTLTMLAGGSYGSEVAWSGSGGGTSTIEAEPSYQTGLQSSGMRTIPDVSFDADPLSGVSVYDSFNDTSGYQPWVEVGGTSLAAPCWAALVAIADQGRAIEGAPTLDGRNQTLAAITALPSSDYHEITSGSNGGFSAVSGYNEVTGLGTPIADLVVPGLASYDVAAKLSFVTEPATSTVAGTALGFTVEVEDSSGALETNYIGTVTLDLTGGPAGSGLNGQTTVVVQNGFAYFSGLTIDQAGSGYVLVAHTAGPGVSSSSSFTISPAAPAQLVVVSPSGPISVGERLNLIVDVEDAYGNWISGYGGTASLTVVHKSGHPAGGALKASQIVNGQTTFSGFRVSSKYLGQEIRISSDGLTSAFMAPVRVVSSAVHLNRTVNHVAGVKAKTAVAHVGTAIRTRAEWHGSATPTTHSALHHRVKVH